MNIQKDSKIKPAFVLYFAQILNLLLGWGITKLNISYLTVGEFGQFSFFIIFDFSDQIADLFPFHKKHFSRDTPGFFQQYPKLSRTLAGILR